MAQYKSRAVFRLIAENTEVSAGDIIELTDKRHAEVVKGLKAFGIIDPLEKIEEVKNDEKVEESVEESVEEEKPKKTEKPKTAKK